MQVIVIDMCVPKLRNSVHKPTNGVPELNSGGTSEIQVLVNLPTSKRDQTAKTD